MTHGLLNTTTLVVALGITVSFPGWEQFEGKGMALRIPLGLLRTRVNNLTAWALGWGLGALAIIWWEAAEWLVQEFGTNGLQLTYGDTIGDLIASSTGGAVGSALAIRFTRDRTIDALTTAERGL